jgi:hypothetical protein
VGTLFHLVQGNKADTSKVVFAKEFQTALGTGRCLNDNVIEHTASGGDSNVVLLWNSREIAKASKDSDLGELSSFACCVEDPLDRLGTSASSGRLQGLLGIFCSSLSRWKEQC